MGIFSLPLFLYKIRKGKSEQYIKNEQELASWLNESLENASLTVDQTEKRLEAEDLDKLARAYSEVSKNLIEYKIYPLAALNAMVNLPVLEPKDLFSNEVVSKGRQPEAPARFENAKEQYKVEVASEDNGSIFCPIVISETHGVRKIFKFGRLFNSGIINLSQSCH